MAKELFNQTLKTAIADDDRIALGLPGMLGCDNIKISDFLPAVHAGNVMVGTFDNADLVGGTWTLVHSKDTPYVKLTVRNPSGYEQNLGGILKIHDNDTVKLEFGGSIDAGDWVYILEYIIVA